MTRPTPRLAPGEVRAWYASTALCGDAGLVARALAWLSDVERARFTRFRHDVDRHMFLLGRVMARAIVGAHTGWAPAAWPWREGPHGRPEIARADTTLRFNIAHSAGLVACAVTDAAEVGVDLEDLDRRETEATIVPRYCAPSEVADIAAAGQDWHQRFLHYWTLKEAYLKARGLGISVPLAEIAFTLGPAPRIAFLGSLAGTSTAWTFSLARPTPRHLAALAVDRPEATPAALEPFPAAWLP